MFSDDVKAEAISRLAGGRSFIMSGGDLGSIRFPHDPDFQSIPPARLEAMCEEVQKEWDIRDKFAPPPKPTLEKQLELLWHDLNNNSLNKGGSFFNMMKQYLDK